MWAIFPLFLTKIPNAMQVNQYKPTALQTSKGYIGQAIIFTQPSTGINYFMRKKSCDKLLLSQCCRLTSYYSTQIQADIEHYSAGTSVLPATDPVTDKLPYRFHHDLLRVGDVQSTNASIEDGLLQKIFWSTVCEEGVKQKVEWK